MPTKSSATLPTPIVALLDLSDDGCRFIHDAIQRTHSGRWPIWRAIAMRQEGSVIVELARVLRRRTALAQFTVLRWDSRARSLSWLPDQAEETARRAYGNHSDPP